MQSRGSHNKPRKGASRPLLGRNSLLQASQSLQDTPEFGNKRSLRLNNPSDPQNSLEAPAETRSCSYKPSRKASDSHSPRSTTTIKSRSSALRRDPIAQEHARQLYQSKFLQSSSQTPSACSLEHSPSLEPTLGIHSPKSELSIRPSSRMGPEDTSRNARRADSHSNSKILKKKRTNSSNGNLHHHPDRPLLPRSLTPESQSLECDEELGGIEPDFDEPDSLPPALPPKLEEAAVPLQPNATLPLTISNLTFHNFFSEWRQAPNKQADNLTVDPNCLERKQLEEVHEHNRHTLLNWIFSLGGSVNFSRETIHVTVILVDLYLSNTRYKIILDDLQLVGVASLSLASKMEEMTCPSMNDLSTATCNYYKPRTIIKMEQDIAKSINYRVAAIQGLAQSMHQLMTEWDAFAALSCPTYALLAGQIAPLKPMFGIMPSRQRKFLEATDPQCFLQVAMYLRAMYLADSIVFQLDSYQYPHEALCASVIYFTLQDVYGFSQPLSAPVDDQLTDMYNTFVLNALGAPFAYLAPTLEFVSRQMHLPIFVQGGRVIPTKEQGLHINPRGMVPKLGMEIQSLFNLLDHIKREHVKLDDIYPFDEMDGRGVTYREYSNGLQKMLDEYEVWKPQRYHQARPMVIKWPSIYVNQSYAQELKKLMPGNHPDRNVEASGDYQSEEGYEEEDEGEYSEDVEGLYEGEEEEEEEEEEGESEEDLNKI